MAKIKISEGRHTSTKREITTTHALLTEMALSKALWLCGIQWKRWFELKGCGGHKCEKKEYLYSLQHSVQMTCMQTFI